MTVWSESETHDKILKRYGFDGCMSACTCQCQQLIIKRLQSRLDAVNELLHELKNPVCSGYAAWTPEGGAERERKRIVKKLEAALNADS